MKTASEPDPRTGIACLQVQSFVIQKFLSLRISSKQNLKATVQTVSVHLIRPHPPTDFLIAVEEHERNTSIMQSPRASQPRHPRPNNQNRLRIRHVDGKSLSLKKYEDMLKSQLP